ncbi:MAG: PilZ domain-containing protein [Candidatus Omnitrophica bacterium]|nr:PilZ domain-containing protein [Candidatus Omnitrophota bacterium]
MNEKRQYVRMGTVFPVEIRFAGDAGERSGLLFQGFTRDVSDGGLCVELKSFGKQTEKLLLVPEKAVDLTINPAFSLHPIQAAAKIVWLKKQDSPFPPRYFIGVSYTRIDPVARARLIGYARRLLWLPRVTAGFFTAVLFVTAGLFLHDLELRKENKLLVNGLVRGAEKRSAIASNLYQSEKEKARLESELTRAKDQIEKEKQIRAALQAIESGREKLKANLENLKKETKAADSLVLAQMLDWIRSHQNARTGLVASFEGDPSLQDEAFTYDQSLASQVFLIFGDDKKAASILSFYENTARKSQGAYFNAYSAFDGQPAENIVQTGPNIWMGLAALQYENKIKDGRFINLARGLGDWVIGLQDEEGGIRGGPGLSWYSTEHNLDAYAFFTMLHRRTNDPKYKQAAEGVLGWIQKYAYSAKDKRFNRGKGDATISTDTFSWAIAALGPALLDQIHFDAEGIIDFAEKNCRVSVKDVRPDGSVSEVKGFDFAKAGHVGRGGIISTEWTAQMIVTYRVLSKYFFSTGEKEKASLYLDKANFYLNELQKLMITSPSKTGQGRGCLPYASIDNADTGHGWRTPKGSRTGSVSGTAYGIFAWVGYNPFSLDNH